MVQLFKSPTLDFGLGHDLRVVGSSLEWGSMLGRDPAWDSLSPSTLLLPSAPPPIKPVLRLLQLITIFIYEATWHFSVLFEGES